MSQLKYTPIWRTIIVTINWSGKESRVMITNTQPRDNRIYNRLSNAEKELIERAAHYLGESASQFVTQCALEKARTTVREYEAMQLDVLDAKALLDALSTPIVPNKNLMKALESHSHRVTSK